MSLADWLANGWLVRHEASARETNDLLDAARADLSDARKDISASGRFAIAYNAALRLCAAVLQTSGYRATRDQKHYRTIASLPLILGADARELADFLINVYLATYTLGVFTNSFAGLGGTELRLMLMAGNLLLMQAPHLALLGWQVLVYDLAGAVMAVAMAAALVVSTLRNERTLYRLERVG